MKDLNAIQKNFRSFRRKLGKSFYKLNSEEGLSIRPKTTTNKRLITIIISNFLLKVHQKTL